MKTLQLSLPEELEKELTFLSHDSESFIITAIREKMQSLHHRDIHSLLQEGYQSTREEDLAITHEFEAADFEHVK